MPRPDVDVFLDGDLKGTMRDAQNVLELESVTAGSHELILLARNRANEIIDRKVIKFSSDGASVASTSPAASSDTISGAASTDGAWTLTKRPATTQTAAVAPAPRPGPVEVAPAMPVSSPPPAPRAPRYESAPRTLADTASSYPTLALAGAGFLLAGFLVRRLR